MPRRSRSRKLVVPSAEEGVNALKAEVMRREGYTVNPERPDDVKYEVAEELGVPLQHGYNGKLTTEEAGQVGGKIGGAMVREMIRMAQEKLARK
jgi:small acid-soluble spore protein D (minor alpha/beta-type SASP)